VFVVTWLFSLFLPSMASAGDQILFVHLKWSTNGVQVLRTDVRPGKLKGPAPSEGRLQIRLADAAGEVAWTGLINDPRRRAYEYPKVDSTNALAQLDVVREEAEIVVRMPLVPGAKEVQVWGEAIPSEPSSAKAGSIRIGETARPLLLRHSLVVSPISP
jgi:hypothetical protein